MNIQYNGANDTEGAGGRTALWWAAIRGEADAAQDLLRGGARVGAADASGWSAVHAAASEDHGEIIDILGDHLRSTVGNSSCMWAEDGRRRTPLHIACAKGALNAVESLLECARAVNTGKTDSWAWKLESPNDNGLTPQQVAVRAGFPVVGQLVWKAAHPPKKKKKKRGRGRGKSPGRRTR